MEVIVIVVVIIAVIALVLWLYHHTKKEALITEPARRAVEETRRLRQQVEANQRAAMAAQADANAVVAKAIEHRRATFFAGVFEPLNYKWCPNGIRFENNAIHIRTKSELNVFVGAWRSYMIRSNPCRVPIEWEGYARMVKAKFNFINVERFGHPDTELEAAQALKRIKIAALTAAIRAVTRYRHKQLRQLKVKVH